MCTTKVSEGARAPVILPEAIFDDLPKVQPSYRLGNTGRERTTCKFHAEVEDCPARVLAEQRAK